MAPHASNDLEWSRKVAKVVVEALLFPRLIGWAAFDPALALATEAIQGWLAKRDYPASAGVRDGQDNVDHAWTEKVARSLVAGLVKAGLVTAPDTDRAVAIAQEEIWINLALDDRPPQKG
jgi:hypothetical protein